MLLVQHPVIINLNNSLKLNKAEARVPDELFWS